MKRYKLPEIGDKFELLEVVGIVPTEWGSGKRTMLRCDCKCGTKNKLVEARKFLNGHTGSCGCLQHKRKDRSRTAEFRAWYGMLQRCTNPKDCSYENYGKRGIKVCERWLDFDNFLTDMGLKPAKKMSLERKNNDGDYEPGNVIWATKKQQANNTRRNRFIEHDGRTLTLKQWSEFSGVPYPRLQMRLNAGWKMTDALINEKLHCGRSPGRKSST